MGLRRQTFASQGPGGWEVQGRGAGSPGSLSPFPPGPRPALPSPITGPTSRPPLNLVASHRPRLLMPSRMSSRGTRTRSACGRGVCGGPGGGGQRGLSSRTACSPLPEGSCRRVRQEWAARAAGARRAVRGRGCRVPGVCCGVVGFTQDKAEDDPGGGRARERGPGPQRGLAQRGLGAPIPRGPCPQPTGSSGEAGAEGSPRLRDIPPWVSLQGAPGKPGEPGPKGERVSAGRDHVDVSSRRQGDLVPDVRGRRAGDLARGGLSGRSPFPGKS